MTTLHSLGPWRTAPGRRFYGAPPSFEVVWLGHEMVTHADALANMALEMNSYLQIRGDKNVEKLQFRIGMNSGPAVAGVVGTAKFHYDLWGDAVNTASRMESHGVPGRIQVTNEMHDLLCDEFTFEERGEIEVKGKGSISTWFLEGRRNGQENPS